MLLTKSVSLADQVFDRLERDILTGKYPIGSYLTELSLCEDLGVSRTPIREALRKLEQEHLIESTGKGMLVRSITERDAEVIFEIRVHAEALAAAACAENITDEALAKMKETVELNEFYMQKGDAEKLRELDSTFHKLIMTNAGSSIYADTLVPLHAKISKFREVALSVEERAGASAQEHYSIYQAIADHDPDAAAAAMMVHIKHAESHLRKHIRR